MDEATAGLLRAEAERVAANAYVPHSRFPVGAALMTAAGNLVAGCNVENASFPLSVCAENNAITSAVALEGRAMRIAALVVVTAHGSPAAPCGACRQIIHEFADAGVPVAYGGAGGLVHTSIGELLPDAFSSEDVIPAG
jgi:cytidine deaminase